MTDHEQEQQVETSREHLVAGVEARQGTYTSDEGRVSKALILDLGNDDGDLIARMILTVEELRSFIGLLWAQVEPVGPTVVAEDAIIMDAYDGE